MAIPPVKRGNAFFANPDALTAETGAHAYINFHHLKGKEGRMARLIAFTSLLFSTCPHPHLVNALVLPHHLSFFRSLSFSLSYSD